MPKGMRLKINLHKFVLHVDAMNYASSLFYYDDEERRRYNNDIKRYPLTDINGHINKRGSEHNKNLIQLQ